MAVCGDLMAATDPAGERVWGPGLCGRDTQGHTQPQNQHSTCNGSPSGKVREHQVHTETDTQPGSQGSRNTQTELKQVKDNHDYQG